MALNKYLQMTDTGTGSKKKSNTAATSVNATGASNNVTSTQT